MTIDGGQRVEQMVVAGPEGAELRLDVADHGPLDGPPVLALHGFPEAGWTWDEVVPLLVGAGRRVVVPTQRGYSPGARPPQRSAYRLERLVADALAVADAAGWDRFHLLGHDWGGIVGWALAAWYPERLSALTSLSTPHPRAYAESLTRSLQGLRSSYGLLFALPAVPEALLRAGGGRWATRALENGGLAHEHAARAARLLAEPGAASGALNWYRAAVTTALRDVGRVAVPTTYVWSTDDVALGRAAAEGTARHVTGPYRFVELAGTSHWIPHEAPEAVADAVLTHP